MAATNFNSPPRLLVVALISQELREGLSKHFILDDYLIEGPSARPIENAPSGYSVVVTRALVGAPPALLDALPNLKLIVSMGAGLERINLPDAARRSVAVAHTPDELTEDVADYAIGLVYAAQRRLLSADRWVRDGLWATAPMGITRRVSSRTVGLVGLGRIGRRIAEKASSLGMTVHYHARREHADTSWRYHPTVSQLAAAVDILILACAGTEETRHLVNAAILEALGPDGIVVNVARGSVVDEDALISALAERRIAGAALDVFESEPAPDPRFNTLENVLLSPHAATFTVESRAALVNRLVGSTLAFFAGEAFPDAAGPHK